MAELPQKRPSGDRSWRFPILSIERIVAVIEVLGGIAGLVAIGAVLYRGGMGFTATEQWLIILAAALLMLLCVAAGVLLWQRRPLGYVLSTIVQVTQVPIVYSTDLIYHFHMLLRLTLTVSVSNAQMSVTPAYGIGLDPLGGLVSLGFYLDTGLGGTILGINALPIILSILLTYARHRNR